MFSMWLSDSGPVMWLIMLCGVIALAVFIERALHLHRARIRRFDLLRGITNLLRRGNTEEALAVCDDTPGPVASLIRTAILHRDEPRRVLREELNNMGKSEISRLERRLSVIAVITQIAPLLGLLGTVFGLIQSLLVIRAQSPLVQMPDLTQGLMDALVTTAGGLMVAIPSYAMFNLLVIKIDRIVLDMEQSCSDVLAILREDGGAPKKNEQKLEEKA